MPRKKKNKKATKHPKPDPKIVIEDALEIRGALELAYYQKYNKQQDFDDGTLKQASELLKKKSAFIKYIPAKETFTGLLAGYALYTIEEGWPKIMQLIIEKNLLKQVKKSPLLHIAISLQRNEILKLLIPHVDLHAVSKPTVYSADKKTLLASRGFKPIHEAARVNNIGALDLLWQHDKQILETMNLDKHTALHMALYSHNFEFAQSMIDKKPSIVNNNVSRKLISKSLYGATELFLSVMYKAENKEIEVGGDKEIIDFLIKNDANINKATKTKVTALHLAIQSHDYAIIKELLSNGANVNSVTKNGLTPLFYAILSNDTEAIKLLIQYKADLTVKNNKGENALEYAICASKLEAFELLLKHQQEEIRHPYFASILDKLDGKLIEWLYLQNMDYKNAYNRNVAIIYLIFINRNSEKLEKIIDFFTQNKITSDILKVNFNYGIQIAIELQDMNLFQRCLDMGARTDQIYQPDNDTLLNRALISNNTEVAKLLIEKHHIDINIANREGLTSAHLAVINGMNDVLKILIANNANLNATDKDGNTPLDYANFAGHEKCIKLLKTALDISPEEAGEMELEEYLLSEEEEADQPQPAIIAPILPHITPVKEDKSSQIGRQLHAINQQRKAKLEQQEEWSQEQKVLKAESWILDSGKEYHESCNIDEKVISVIKHNKIIYCVIPNSLALEANLLQKFEHAIEVGFVGNFGQAGIKTFKKKIAGGQSQPCLYEVKIYSSEYGDYRMFTSNKYTNANGSELLIFENIGNHADAKLAARNSAKITNHNVGSVDDSQLAPHNDDLAPLVAEEKKDGEEYNEFPQAADHVIELAGSADDVALD